MILQLAIKTLKPSSFHFAASLFAFVFFLVFFFTNWSVCWFRDWYVCLFEGVFKAVCLKTIIWLQLTMKHMKQSSFHFTASLFAFLPTGQFVGFLIDTFICLKACSKLPFVWDLNIIVISYKDYETEQCPFCCFLICFFTYWSLCWFLDWYISLFEGVFKTVGFLLRFETIISLQLTIKLMRPNSFHFAASLFAFLPTGRFVGFLIDTFVCLKACSKLPFVWDLNIIAISYKDYETEQCPFAAS